MNNISYEKLLPQALSGDSLISSLRYHPEYDDSFREEDQFERLGRLADIYKIYEPFPMAVEIYNKLRIATVMSLQKKNTKLAVQQRNETYRTMISNGNYHGIIGGADSLTIVGQSGIGKSSAIGQALALISGGIIITMDNPPLKIIPCIQVQCPFDASPKGMLLEILRNVDMIIGTSYCERSKKSSATTDTLIGTVSQVCLNHIGLLVIDEIQNVYGRKNGILLVSMLIQLINSSGISVAMVGTEECVSFFKSSVQFARRAQGLRYGALSYDEYFEDFCRLLWKYQYTATFTEIDIGIIEWLYEHSGGVISNVISMVHDAQEIAILEGYEKLDINMLCRAYKTRMSFMHDFVTVEKKDKNQSHHHEKNNIVLENGAHYAQDAHLTLEEMVIIAKDKGLDPIAFLKENIVIEEVDVQ